jgi:hypothetical protein
MKKHRIQRWWVVLLPAIGLAQTSPVVVSRKLIYLGWDAPTPDTFQREVLALEAKNISLDGTVVEFTASDDNADGYYRPFSFGFAGNFSEMQMEGPLKEAWLQPGIAAMNSVSPKRIRYNFLRFLSQPGNVDWFDDTGWTTIVETARLAGYAAAKSGLVGIFYDPEPYVEGYAQFDYLRQNQYGKHSFDEYVTKARLRGRQFMQAIQSEYPDVTILTAFLNSYQLSHIYRGPDAFGLDDPKLALVGSGYALLPAFLDGWLDVMGPNVKIIDGNENSYYFVSEFEYELARSRVVNQGVDTVAPENRETYRKQVQVGFAVYMDAYNRTHELALDLPTGDTYPSLYRRNLATALRATDEYVWLYGETGAFFSNGDTPFWGVKFPWILPSTAKARKPINWPPQSDGVIEAVGRVTTNNNRLLSWAHARYQAAVSNGTVASRNLLLNPTFDVDTSNWELYNDPDPGIESTGVLLWGADGSAKVVHAKAANLYQLLEVVGGEKLWVSANFKRNGWSEPSLSMDWRRADNSFIPNTGRTFFAAEYKSNVPGVLRKTPWSIILGASVVPDDAVQLLFSLDATGQRRSYDDLYFDNAVVMKVGDAEDGPSLDVISSATNIIDNYSFEEGLQGWSTSGSVELVNDPYSGVSALRIGPQGGVTRRFDAVPGQQFRLQAYAKLIGKTDAAVIAIRFVDENNLTIGGSLRKALIKDTHFQDYLVTGVAPKGAVRIVIYGRNGSANSDLVLDDCRVQVVSPKT